MSNLLISLLASYLLGSFPTSYLLGRIVGKIDIRQQGSGNVGATNVFRVMGKGWGVFVLVVDILKGFLAVTLLATFFHQGLPLIELTYCKFILGLAAICGHNWPVWLRFKGGKGVATSAGVFLGILPKAVGLCFLIWIIVLSLSRYISLASISAALAFPVFVFMTYSRKKEIFILLPICIFLALLIVYTHRSNIKRLLKGTENRFVLRKSSSD